MRTRVRGIQRGKTLLVLATCGVAAVGKVRYRSSGGSSRRGNQGSQTPKPYHTLSAERRKHTWPTLTIFLTLHLLYTLFFFSVLRDSLISSPCPGRHGGKPSSLSSSAASTKLTSLTSYRVISHTKMAQPNLRDRSLSSRLVAEDPHDRTAKPVS